MAALALRALAVLAVVYLGALGGLYLAQASLIYPAPQQQHAPTSGSAAVVLRTEDDLALTAHWRAAEAGKPTVVYFHGNGGSLAGAAIETARFADLGYGVLLVEYRGYGGNPGTPSEAGFYRDGSAAMAFLAAQGVPSSRTIVIGNSIGSGTATEMAKAFRPAALILTSPFTSLGNVVRERMPVVPVDLLLRDRFDNLAKIEALTIPVLVLHGTDDQVVPFAHGKALAAASPKAKFIAFDGAGHELSFRPEAQAAQTDWLAAQGL